MKKILAAFIASFALLSSTFAVGFYSGDAQINVGASFLANAESQTLDGKLVASVIDGSGFDVTVQTYQMINLNSVFGLGLRARASFSYNKYGHVYFKVQGEDMATSKYSPATAFLSGHWSFGPAVAFTIGPVVKLSLGVGVMFPFVDYEFDSKNYSGKSFYANPSVGFDAELQAKFLPKSPVSPLVGCRFEASFPKFVDTYDKTSIVSTKEPLADSIYILTTCYVGVSFNW